MISSNSVTIPADVVPLPKFATKYSRLQCIYDLDAIYDMAFDVINTNPDNGVKLLIALQKIDVPLLAEIGVDILDEHKWFYNDYCKHTFITRHPDTGEIATCQRRRMYFWDDDHTDYDALAQTMVNTLNVADMWINDNHSGSEADEAVIENVMKVYDTLVEMHDVFMNDDTTSEEAHHEEDMRQVQALQAQNA